MVYQHFYISYFTKPFLSENLAKQWFPVDLVTFAEETLDAKLHLLCSGL